MHGNMGNGRVRNKLLAWYPDVILTGDDERRILKAIGFWKEDDLSDRDFHPTDVGDYWDTGE